MNAILAIDGLSATHPRQRARCAVTGRFIAWARVPTLRLATSKGVVGRSVPAVSVSVSVSVSVPVSAPVSAPVSVSVAPVSASVSVARVSAVRAVRAFGVIGRTVRAIGRAVRAIGRAFGLARRTGRTGRTGIGGDVPT